jgi:hypothetical protein
MSEGLVFSRVEGERGTNDRHAPGAASASRRLGPSTSRPTCAYGRKRASVETCARRWEKMGKRMQRRYFFQNSLSLVQNERRRSPDGLRDICELRLPVRGGCCRIGRDGPVRPQCSRVPAADVLSPPSLLRPPSRLSLSVRSLGPNTTLDNSHFAKLVRDSKRAFKVRGRLQILLLCFPPLRRGLATLVLFSLRATPKPPFSPRLCIRTSPFVAVVDDSILSPSQVDLIFAKVSPWNIDSHRRSARNGVRSIRSRALSLTHSAAPPSTPSGQGQGRPEDQLQGVPDRRRADCARKGEIGSHRQLYPPRQ